MWMCWASVTIDTKGEWREIRLGALPAIGPPPKDGDHMSDQTASEIATYFRVCNGARVRYADTETESDTVVLMLAPWPESLWAFRRIWRQVTEVGRVLALDMPGFGHSDQPDELIAPDAAGDFLARLIDEWDLGAPHVVGPDVGTAAALFPGSKGTRDVDESHGGRWSSCLPNRDRRGSQGGDRRSKSR